MRRRKEMSGVELGWGGGPGMGGGGGVGVKGN